MATGFRTLHNAIRNRFSDDFVDTSSNIGANDIAWDNSTFEGHDSGQASVWVRFQVLPGESLQRDLGLAPARTTGVALASVFTLAGKGDKVALTLADEIVSAFRAVTHTFGSGGDSTTVFFQSPTVNPVGRDGAWWQINVSIPFYSDDA